MQALRQSSRRVVSVEKWGGMLQRSMSGTGKVLSEEEKARENVYIKKMEKEKLEKLHKEGHHPHEEPAPTSSTQSTETKPPPPSTESSMNAAVWAGVAAAGIGGYFLFSGSGSKKEEK